MNQLELESIQRRLSTILDTLTEPHPERVKHEIDRLWGEVLQIAGLGQTHEPWAILVGGTAAVTYRSYGDALEVAEACGLAVYRNVS